MSESIVEIFARNIKLVGVAIIFISILLLYLSYIPPLYFCSTEQSCTIRTWVVGGGVVIIIATWIYFSVRAMLDM